MQQLLEKFRRKLFERRIPAHFGFFKERLQMILMFSEGGGRFSLPRCNGPAGHG